MPNIVLPFKQKDIYLGLAEISGLMRVADEVLELEYKVKDTTLGFMDSSVKTCHIPIRIIDTIEVEKKWFSVKFELIFNRIPDLDNPFQLEGNHLKLSVKKDHLEKANAFRSKLMYEILEGKMDEDEAQDEEPVNRPKKRKETPRPRRSNRNTGGLENMLRDDE